MVEDTTSPDVNASKFHPEPRIIFVSSGCGTAYLAQTLQTEPT